MRDREGFCMFVAEESMLPIRRAIALIASVLLLQGASAAASPPSAPSLSAKENKVALKYLWWSLKHGRKGGHFYYTVPDCDRTDRESLREIQIIRPMKPLADVAGVRRFFAGGPQVRVSDRDGIIRIDFGGVPMEILRTKIARIKFSPDAQYNPQVAVEVVEGAPEVEARMKRLNVRTLDLPIEMLVAEPNPKLTHLDPEMKNVTMDEALDGIARRFHGLVETGYCRSSRVMGDFFVGGSDENEGNK